MWFVVTYDISADDRRERMADLLGRYGGRVQQSVFECQLGEQDLERMLAQAGTILGSPENGSLRLYRWCAACRDASTGLGDVEETDEGMAWIV